MFRKARALLTFLTREEGGRKRPLVFNTITADSFFYYAIINFDAAPASPEDGLWDVVVTDPLATGENTTTFTANIYHSSQDEGAPDWLMVKGATFGLYEGPHLVARGVILTELE